MKLIISLVLVFNNFVFTSDLEQKVDTYLDPYLKTNDFSGCVLIAKDNKILLSKGYGFADRSFEIINKPDTKFRLASVSKQFTAAAILILEQQEKLSTEDVLEKYIPRVPGADKIKIHHLLNHTAGVRDIFSLPGYDTFKYLPLQLNDIIEKIKGLPVLTEPGVNYAYSNSGYALLAQIIEKVSGKSYGQFIKENIFLPLKMNNSGEYNNKVIYNNFAEGYDPIGYTDLLYADYTNNAVHKGSGSLYSTVEDLFKWDRFLYTNQLLSDSSFKKMFTPYSNAYGYGVSVYKRAGKKVISHDGRMPGYIANIARYIDDDAVIIFLGNIQSGVGDYLRDDLFSILFEKDYKNRAKEDLTLLKMSSDTKKEYCGKFEFAPTFHVNVFLKNNLLWAQANDGEWSEIVPVSKDTFFCRVLYATVKFNFDNQQRVESMTWINNDGNQFSGKKVNDSTK